MANVKVLAIPSYNYLRIIRFTFVQNVLINQKFSEYHSGYRAFSKQVLENLPLEENSNDFIFDQQIIFQAAHFGFKVYELPVATKYFEGASSISFKRSTVYGLSTLGVITQYLMHKYGVVQCSLFHS